MKLQKILSKYKFLITYFFIVMVIIGYIGYTMIVSGYKEATSSNIQDIARWSNDYKNNQHIMNMISKSMEDNVITKAEYYDILSSVVKIIKKENDEEKNKNFKIIKANLGEI